METGRKGEEAGAQEEASQRGLVLFRSSMHRAATRSRGKRPATQAGHLLVDPKRWAASWAAGGRSGQLYKALGGTGRNLEHQNSRFGQAQVCVERSLLELAHIKECFYSSAKHHTPDYS